MNPIYKVQGLYAVTPDTEDSARLARDVQAALEGGVRVVQYRNKSTDTALRRYQASALCALCQAHGAALIVNDDVALALEIDAHGVHLGREDGSIEAARARLGPHKLLGASCYRSLENAALAIAAGADHIAFGSFFVSTVKPGAVRSSPTILTEAKRKFGVPVVAIGGITPANATQLIEAGADSVAVITALFSAPDIAQAAREFTALFKANHS
jgi:thiamine-phosphate pyrophosphorylase